MNYLYKTRASCRGEVDLEALAVILGHGKQYREGDSWRVPCPAHGGKDLNLKISVGKDGKLWPKCFSHNCTQHAIMDAIRAIAPALLPSNRGERTFLAPRVPPPQALDAKPISNQSRARKIWNQSIPAENTLAETYLRDRGYTGAIPPTLRFHPKLWHKDARAFYPAMVGAVTLWPNDDPIDAIHRTYLKADGAGKAFIQEEEQHGKENKMMLGPVTGGAVRLSQPGPILVLAEGVETALSVFEVTGLPVWAALSAGGMESVVVPPVEITREIIIACDHDEPKPPHLKGRGERAAYALYQRLVTMGYKFDIRLPPKPGDDWLDHFNNHNINI